MGALRTSSVVLCGAKHCTPAYQGSWSTLVKHKPYLTCMLAAPAPVLILGAQGATFGAGHSSQGGAGAAQQALGSRPQSGEGLASGSRSLDVRMVSEPFLSQSLEVKLLAQRASVPGKGRKGGRRHRPVKLLPLSAGGQQAIHCVTTAGNKNVPSVHYRSLTGSSEACARNI
jgi:hypothetical protein